MPADKHRVVIDTNLWVSFLLSRNFSKLDRLLATGQVLLLVSRALLDELVEVAERPKFRKYFDLSELANLIASLKQQAELVSVTSRVTVCRDEKDNFLLALAIDGAATHLPTGDKDLLVLHPFGETQVQTITAYLSAN